jgi:type IV pilus assembly protein PilA
MSSLLKKMFKQNEAGFTLVELMAVVLIIGVLVAVAVPVYQNSSADAKLKSCKANIRTIYGAISQYQSATSTANDDVDDITVLKPTYMKTIPACPAKPAATYTVTNGDVNESAHFQSGTYETATAHTT